jgi:xanthine dehydrogenase/oxidase
MVWFAPVTIHRVWLVLEYLLGNRSGACTCVIQTYKGSRLRHLAVNACLFPLVGGKYLIITQNREANKVTVIGKHVITIEGLGDVENPHPLQERIAKLHGSQ